MIFLVLTIQDLFDAGGMRDTLSKIHGMPIGIKAPARRRNEDQLPSIDWKTRLSMQQASRHSQAQSSRRQALV